MAVVHHGSHWGAFRAETAGGRVTGALPFAKDPEPSPVVASIPDAVHHASRIAGPMARRGWLDGDGGEGRGRDSYVPLDWDRAVDLIAGEVARVGRDFGNASIFGGSYGWASAGRFHHAKSQLHRFLCMAGGFTSQLHNYSYAAGLAVLPHILGGVEAAAGPVTDWPSIVEHTGLMVSFGGLPVKNAQVDSGGNGRTCGGGLYTRAAGKRGVRFVAVSPLGDDLPAGLGGEWIPIRPGTDTAMMLALCQTLLSEGLADRAFLERYCTGAQTFEASLDGRTPEWAEGITGVPAARIRALAREMAAARTMISTAWALQRGDHGEQPFWATVALAACLGQIGLPGGGFGFGYGCVSGIGAPRHGLSGPTFPIGPNPVREFIPVARIADMLLDPGGAYDFDGERRRYPDTRLVYWAGRQPVPPPPGYQPAHPRLPPAGNRDRPRPLVDGDGPPCRYRRSGDDDAGAQRHRRRQARPLLARHAPRHRPGGPRAPRPRRLRRYRRPPRLPRGLHRGAGRDGVAAPHL